MVLRTAILNVTAWMARRENLKSQTDTVMRFLARSIVKSKGIEVADSVAALGQEWQKAFPADGKHPIIQITEDTVYAEIHTDCPLKGTGDIKACHRLMVFDRQLLEHAGGNFVVLQSQAQSGHHVCKVGMRLKDTKMDDLAPVYKDSM